jgi:hypothetical protein
MSVSESCYFAQELIAVANALQRVAIRRAS